MLGKLYRLGICGGFHFTQTAFDGARTHAGVLDLFAGLIELVFDFVQHIAKLTELGFGFFQNAPDLGRAFFDRHSTKPHLQTGQQGQQCGGTSHGNALLALQGFKQAGAAQHFGVQAFGGQK